MGSGYMYRCTQCRRKYEVFEGVGFLFPMTCKETMEEILRGKHGEERQRVALDTPGVRIDARNVVYMCPACGRWEVATDLTLYAPSASKGTTQNAAGQQEEGCMLPDRKGYRVVLPFAPECAACHAPMRPATEREIAALPCPRCGTPNHPLGSVCWD